MTEFGSYLVNLQQQKHNFLMPTTNNTTNKLK